MALSAAASAVALFGFGKMAKADTKSFQYDYNTSFGQGVPNTGTPGVWSGDLTQNYWYDLNTNTPGTVTPGAGDIAQFDTFFANLNPTGNGGPPVFNGNVLLTLAAGQTNFGGLNILSPGEFPQWVNASGVTAAFAMVIGGTDTTSFLQIGSGGINVAGSGSFVGTDTNITVPVTLTAAQTWSVVRIPVTLTNAVTNGTTAGVVTNSTGLNVSGGISLGGQGSNALIINGGGNVTLNGGIADGGAASGIAINGTTTVTFNSNNTFSGGLALGAGSFATTAQGFGFGTTGNLISMNGGTIQVTGTGVNNFNNYSINGSGIGVAGNGTDVTWNNVPLNINISNGGNVFTINQHLTGASEFLNQSGAGTIVLGQATNTYNGGTTIGTGSTLTIQDFAALGTGSLTNNGILNLLTSDAVSGGQAGNGGLQIGGGFGSTLTLTNSNGPVTNNLVGVFGNATLVLDFAHSDAGQPLISGTNVITSGTNSFTFGPTLNMGGGNLLIVPNATATTVQVFATTTFTGASATVPGHIQSITATGAAGQATVFFGSFNWGLTGAGYSSIIKAGNQYGNEVIFNGPLSGVGTTTPVSDFAVTGYLEPDGAPLVSNASAGAGVSGGFTSSYYSGYALYGNSDWAAITPAVNGTSYIVPGSALSGFYTETSTITPNTTSNLFTSDGIAIYVIPRQPTAAGGLIQNWDVDAPGPVSTQGNSAETSIRFNSPTGGFSTAGGNAAIQFLVTAGSIDESSNRLMTANVGASNLIFADLGKVASGATSAGTQDLNLSRGSTIDATFWNMDFQGNTAGIMIFATGMSDSRNVGAGVSLLGPGAFALVTTSGYTAMTTIQGGLAEISSDASLGGSGGTQNPIDLNAGTLVAVNSFALDNSLYNTGTLRTRAITIDALGGVLAASNGTTMKVDGTMTGTGNLVIGMGTFTNVTETLTTSTLGFSAASGGGTVILAGNHTGFTGNISVSNLATLQLDGSYSAATTVTLPSGASQELDGAPTTTISNVSIGSGVVFYPGDVGNGQFTAANITFGNTSSLQLAMNPATTSTTDVLTISQLGGLNFAGTQNLVFRQAGTSQNFNTTGIYDLLNVVGSTNAFNINGTLAVNGVSTQVANFLLSGLAVTPFTTYALATVPLGSNETELELLISSQVIAATWNNSGSGVYDLNTNWITNNGLQLTPNGLVDTAIFSSNGLSNPTTVTLAAAGDTAGNLVFNSTNTYVLSGGQLLLNNGSAASPVSAVVLDQLGNHTLASTIAAPGGVSVVVVNSTDTLTMSGLISNGYTGASTLASAGLQINGVNLQGSPIQQGSGTVILTLNGSETYTGGTNIFGGTLQLGNGVAATIIPTQGTTPMLLDGSLVFDEPSGNSYTFVNTVNNANGNGTFVENSANTLVTLTPVSAYLGNVPNLTVTAGTLKEGNGSAATWGVTNMNTSGTIDLNGFNTTMGSLSGTGGFIKSASGTITLNVEGNGASTTFGGTITNTGGTLSFNKAGGGNMVLTGTSSYTGSTTIAAGTLRFTSTTNILPTGTLTIASSGNNGPLILSNGVTFANPIISNLASADILELPDANETAYLSGPLQVTNTNQYRMGMTNASALLYLSGTEVNLNTNLGFFEGGHIYTLQNFSLTAGNGIGFGRTGQPLDFRMYGNSAITLSQTPGGVLNVAGAGATIGFNANGGNNPQISIEMDDQSSMNLGNGNLELDNSGAASVLNSVILNGGAITTGGVTFNPPSAALAANATAVIDFNGGILIAGASQSNFLPSGTLGNFYMNVGSLGVKLSTNGFNEIIGSLIGFNSGSASGGPPNSDPNFVGADGGIKKLGSGNLSFTSNFGSSALGSPVDGRTEIVGGSLDYAGHSLSTNGVDMLGNTAYIQVDAGGAIGVDDGSTTDTSFLGKMTAAGAPATQSGGFLLSTSDLATNIDYTGLVAGAFNMTHPGSTSVSFVNMSIGAVADPSGTGTTGVALVYTGTITPPNVGPFRNTYLLGGGGTLELAQVNALTGARKLLAENSGVVKLDQTNNYSGGTTIQGANVLTNDITGATNLETTTLLVGFLGDADGRGTSLGTADPTNPANLQINGGTLEYFGTGDTSNLLFTVGALGGVLDASGSGALILQNTGSEAFGAGVAGTFAFTLSGTEGTIGTIQSIAAGTASSVNVLYATVNNPANTTLTLVKSGVGAWELKGTNNFSGGMQILGGELQLGQPNALNLNNNNSGNFSQVTINGLLDLNGNNLTVGLVTGNTNGVIDDVLNKIDPVLTISTGNFPTPLGTLSNSATYSGAILNSNGTFGLTSVVLTGNGNQIFSGNSNFYAGGTTISGTSTTLTLAGSNGTLGATPVGTGNITDGGLLQLSRGDVLLTLSNNITGAGQVKVTNGTYLFAMSTASWTGGTTIGVTGTGSMIRQNTANILPAGGLVTLVQAFDVNGFNTQFNVSQLSGTGEFTNTLNTATLTLTNTTAAGTLGLNFQNGINSVTRTTGSLAVVFTGGGNIALSSTNSTNIGSTVIDTGTTLSLTGANGTPLGGALNTVYDNGVLVIQGANTTENLANNIVGTGSLFQTAGTVTYSGTNTYSGGTTLNGAADAIIGSLQNPLGSAGLVENAFINMNGNNLTVGGVGLSGTAAGAQIFQGAVATATFTNQGTGTTTFAGAFKNTGSINFGGTIGTVVSGLFSVVQAGPGTLVLTGANTYDGTTSITGGTLEVGNNGATGQLGSVGAISVSTGSALIYNLSSNATVVNNITGGGTFSQIGSGTTTLQGNNSYASTNIGSGSSLLIGSVGGLPSGAPITNNGNLLISAGTKATPVVAGQIKGAGTLTVGVGGTASYLKLATNSHTSTVTAAVVNNGSTLDIGNDTLQINFGSPANDPVTTITNQLGNAYNGGLWTGTAGTIGIITSTTAQTTGGPALAVGINDGNNDAGAAAGPNQIVLKYTLAGDTNLDGLVNFTDLVAVVQNFNKAGTDWAHGNFLFGTSTNFNDLVAVVQNFNKVLTPAASSGDSLGGGGTLGLSSTVEVATPVQVQNTAVQLPEPASFTLLGAGAAGLLARRRRKASK